MKFFNDILTGNTTHKPKEESPPSPLDAVLETIFNKLMGTPDTPELVREGGRRCLEILDDMRFREELSKQYAEHIQAIRKLNITQLFAILQQWRDSYACTCGDPGHKADLVLMHDLLPIIKDEVMRRLAEAK